MEARTDIMTDSIADLTFRAVSPDDRAVLAGWPVVQNWQLSPQHLETSEFFCGLEGSDQISAPASDSARASLLVSYIAFQWAGPDKIEILSLATRAESRRQGVMRSTLGAFFRFLPEKVTEIWLEVHAGNEPARRLYGALGFQEVGSRPAYYSDGACAILLTKALPSDAGLR